VGEPEIRSERADSPAGRALLVAYIADATTRIGEWDETRTPPASAEAMAPPGGAFLVAYLAGEPVGCAGLVHLDENAGEVKRMYVAPAARRRGLARALLARLEEAALAAGYARVRLDTSAGQPEARALYEAMGYRHIEAYNDNQYAAHWFEKELG
jgi:GNAT superfamily N-acetyltransferase